MKVRCEGCKDYKSQKQLPDYQVTFNNWCEMFQTPCALIKECDFYPDTLKNIQKQNYVPNTYDLFDIFTEKRSSSSNTFIK